MNFHSHPVRSLLLAVLFAVPLASAPLFALADDGGTSGEASSVDVSDADIESFAAALTDVQEIGQEWTQRMQEAETQDEVGEMREEARDQMAAAIEDRGLTVEEYNAIATAAQDDPELAQRIQQAAAEQ